MQGIMIPVPIVTGMNLSVPIVVNFGMKINNKDFNYSVYIDRNIYNTEMYQWLISKYDLPYGPTYPEYHLHTKKQYIPLNPNSQWIFGNPYVKSKKFQEMSLVRLCFQRVEDFTLFSLTWPTVDVSS